MAHNIHIHPPLAANRRRPKLKHYRKYPGGTYCMGRIPGGGFCNHEINCGHEPGCPNRPWTSRRRS